MPRAHCALYTVCTGPPVPRVHCVHSLLDAEVIVYTECTGPPAPGVSLCTLFAGRKGHCVHCYLYLKKALIQEPNPVLEKTTYFVVQTNFLFCFIYEKY